MCARVGGVLAPMLHFLRGVSPLAPMVLCGLCPLLGSTLTLLLPETANKRLPDTVEDVEGPDLRCGSIHLPYSLTLTLGSASNTFSSCYWLKVVAESFLHVLQWGGWRCEAPPSGDSDLNAVGRRGHDRRLMVMRKGGVDGDVSHWRISFLLRTFPKANVSASSGSRSPDIVSFVLVVLILLF